ncbi:MAG: DHH family phosphoesterase [Anaerolineales bacterium]|jgi:manganese-dependent inorganic pyrophosphatase
MKNPIYVVGHVNPDTDSVAAAIGYAWLLRERDGDDVIAARAGALNPQTSWVLNRLKLDTPFLLTDASPRFESVSRRMDTITPNRPLREGWAIASRTGGVAPIVNDDGTPYGLITGLTLFEFLGGMIGPHPKRQEIRISEILEIPCHEAADTKVPHFQSSMRIRDILPRILREERNNFFVVDEAGKYQGVCRQRDILNPPRLRLILVDHNEAEQSIGAMEEAEILEILDHHRLGNHSTRMPIRFTVDVVGSTSTLVSERIEEAGLSAPPKIAGMLLSGLISDTLMLSSPTSTKRDHLAADRLGRWSFSWDSPLKDETLESFGKQVLKAGAGLETRKPSEIVSGDLKLYEHGDNKFAIAQVEVTDLVQLSEHLEPLSRALTELRLARGVNFAMLMVTDVVRGSSRILMENAPPTLEDLPYPLQPDGTRLAEDVVSRKKQLVPVVLGLLES